MDYQKMIEDLEEIDDEIAEDITPAIRVVKAIQKISIAVNNSDSLESMMHRIVGIISDMEEEF